MIRGHQCAFAGIATFASDRCLTVFSASSYGPSIDSSGGVLAVDSESAIAAHVLPPIRPVVRRKAHLELYSRPCARTMRPKRRHRQGIAGPGYRSGRPPAAPRCSYRQSSASGGPALAPGAVLRQSSSQPQIPTLLSQA
jgi:hypothetical protein